MYIQLYLYELLLYIYKYMNKYKYLNSHKHVYEHLYKHLCEDCTNKEPSTIAGTSGAHLRHVIALRIKVFVLKAVVRMVVSVFVNMLVKVFAKTFVEGIPIPGSLSWVWDVAVGHQRSGLFHRKRICDTCICIFTSG